MPWHSLLQRTIQTKPQRSEQLLQRVPLEMSEPPFLPPHLIQPPLFLQR